MFLESENYLDMGTTPPAAHGRVGCCKELRCVKGDGGRWAWWALTGQGAHEAAAAVTEGGLSEGDLMEGVQDSQAHLGADAAGAEQVFSQLLSAKGAAPRVETVPQHEGTFSQQPQGPHLQRNQKSGPLTPGCGVGEAHGKRRGSCRRGVQSPPERWCHVLQDHSS